MLFIVLMCNELELRRLKWIVFIVKFINKLLRGIHFDSLAKIIIHF